MLVVVWLVQLFIYPGLRRIERDKFKNWHARYLKLAGYIIGPLMLGQLGFAIGKVISADRWVSEASLYSALVLLTWIVTFRVFVPIHDSLQEKGHNLGLIGQLVTANWMRTILWSLIVFVSL